MQLQSETRVDVIVKEKIYNGNELKIKQIKIELVVNLKKSRIYIYMEMNN